MIPRKLLCYLDARQRICICRVLPPSKEFRQLVVLAILVALDSTPFTGRYLLRKIVQNFAQQIECDARLVLFVAHTDCREIVVPNIAVDTK